MLVCSTLLTDNEGPGALAPRQVGVLAASQYVKGSFSPLPSVSPVHVLEIAFGGLAASTRYKSGFLDFP